MSLLDDNLDIDIKVLWRTFIKDLVLNHCVNLISNYSKLKIEPPRKSIIHKSKYILAYKYTNREYENNHITICFIPENKMYDPKYGYPLYFNVKTFVRATNQYNYAEMTASLYTLEILFNNRDLMKDYLYEPTR